MKRLSLNILLFFLFFSCTEEQKPLQNTSVSLVHEKATTALVFKKEKKIELWSVETPSQLIKTLEKKDFSSVPSGLYTSKNSSTAFSTISKQVSSITGVTHSKIIVFPNDPRPLDIIEPCFACSFNKASTYAKLEMLIKEYPL